MKRIRNTLSVDCKPELKYLDLEPALLRKIKTNRGLSKPDQEVSALIETLSLTKKCIFFVISDVQFLFPRTLFYFGSAKKMDPDLSEKRVRIQPDLWKVKRFEERNPKYDVFKAFYPEFEAIFSFFSCFSKKNIWINTLENLRIQILIFFHVFLKNGLNKRFGKSKNPNSDCCFHLGCKVDWTTSHRPWTQSKCLVDVNSQCSMICIWIQICLYFIR